MPAKLIDITGRTFNWLTVVERAKDNTKQGKPRWICRCICGETKTVSGSHLKNSSIQSCGCVRKETKGSKHHLWSGYEEISGGWWCNHVTNKAEKRGIKIKVDKKYMWDLFIGQDRKCALTGLPLTISYVNAINTASVDRIDSSKDYEPGNVQWVHKQVNRMKSDFKQDRFIELCKLISKEN